MAKSSRRPKVKKIYNVARTDLRAPGQPLIKQDNRPTAKRPSGRLYGLGLKKHDRPHAPEDAKVVQRLNPFDADDGDSGSLRAGLPKDGTGGGKKVTEFIVWKILKIGRPRSP